MTLAGLGEVRARSTLVSLRYRPEIDGLRAVAVVLVIFYHARVPGFDGGYIGVDVFFVISGYLITQLLAIPEQDLGLRALSEFYVRRARRLLPALYLLLAVCAAFAICIFLPGDLKTFGRSLLLAAAFLGNFGAWLDGGYFDPGERFTPLRHLWSIGVEEQFYLFFPVFLAVVAYCPKRFRAALIIGAFFSSLGLSEWAVNRWPIPNYYMLPSRAWELLAGAVCALTADFPPISVRVNQVLSALGIVVLALVAHEAGAAHFPGAASLLACAATAVLLSSNSHSLTSIGRVLSWRPLVFTGLISYSLYLWHAPVLAFYSYYQIKEPSWQELALILTGVYALAALSWGAVEQPFRRLALERARAMIFRLAVPCMCLLGGLGLFLMKSERLPAREPAAAGALRDQAAPPIDAQCLDISDQRVAAGNLCSFGPTDDRAKSAVVWGDSHAFALLPTYRELAQATGVRIYFAVRGACWPLVGSEAASAGEYWRSRCANFNAAMVRGLQHIRPQRVILNAYWLDPGAASQPEFFSRASQPESAIAEGIARTVQSAKQAGASVCAVLTVPGYSYPIPYALAMAQQRHINIDSLTLTRAAAVQQYHVVEGDFRRLAAERQLTTSDPKDVLCPGSHCLIVDEAGSSLYRDNTHVSGGGASLLYGVLQQCVADLRR